MLHAQQQHSFSPLDLNILNMLTGDSAPTTHAHPAGVGAAPRSGAARKNQSDRRPPVDPLMVAAAAAAGPDITRNHYLHEFFPHTLAYASCDDERPQAPPPARPKMQSQQAPRRVRLATEAEEKRKGLEKQAQDTAAAAVPTPTIAIPGASSSSPPPATTAQVNGGTASARRMSTSDPATIKLLRQTVASPPLSPSHAVVPNPPSTLAAVSSAVAASAQPLAPSLPPLVVKCEVRTRIPTPHGHIFLHLYSNNHDQKEHLAFVADQAQMDALHPATDVGTPQLPFLRSTTLDSEWRHGETEMERIVRGAYVGRLSASTIHPSTSPASVSAPLPSTSSATATTPEPPLVRIHSECFTGEVIGSQRCDCGEQLDEAFRLITLHQRGVVVYLRQEGRGIGLLEKMRAYNLQDLGHDTVTANLMLGHGADMRTYDIAGAILRDLKINEVRLLTNNPDKIEQIEKEGVRVVERVAMVPRSWIPTNRTGGKKRKGAAARRARMSGAALLQQGLDSMASSVLSSAMPSSDEGHGVDSCSDESYTDDSDAEEDDDGLSFSSSSDSDASHNLRRSGVGMIGASVTRSAELEKYLRTKIERMGHMLEAPSTPIDSPTSTSRAESPAPSSLGHGHGHGPGHRHRKPKMKRTSSAMSSGAGAAKPHPLASSVVSVEGEECGQDCKECKEV